ncbi:hypothetical protein TWF730_002222 [Orbilia blumenaviensis]|uniref:RanBD1 domain-containing protein n=1 Tax=Orbilia blumenaviensis TaxID=1796055 RepID=A0AAV9UE11_9PEZI
MAKRGATEQITKDTWERDEDDGGRDRSEEPAEVASQAVLAKRKILKPKSRVGGVTAAATAPNPSPAPSGLFNFGQPASSSTSTSSLFGQQTTNISTPSKNIFGQAAPLSSTPTGNPFVSSNQSQKPLFSNLFGAPETPSEPQSAASEAAQVKGSVSQTLSTVFGSPTPQPAATTPKPSAFVFGAPASQALKPGPSIFSTSASGSNGTAAGPREGLFGFATQNPQDLPGGAQPPSAATPAVTPVKPSLFNLFGDNNTVPTSTSTFGAQSHPQISDFIPKEKETNEKTSFGQGNGLFAPNGSQANSKSPFSVSQAEAARPISTSDPFKTIGGTTTEPSGIKDALGNVKAGKRSLHDPESLTPPPGVGVTKLDMPAFNWLYQVKSLNSEFQERVQEALQKDPFTDLTSFIGFYNERLTRFDSAKLSQQDQVHGKADTSNDTYIQNPDGALATPSKASKMFESALGQSDSRPTNPIQKETSSTADARPFSGSVFQPKPSGLFSQPPINANISSSPAESIFSGATAKSTGLFGTTATSVSSNDTKAAPLFQFGIQNKAPVNIFDPTPPKDSDNAGPKLFPSNSLWTSKPNSAVASNASSPGSVLASGTAGLKDSDAGGWSNPFTQDNPLFLPGAEDDDDDDDDDHDEGEGEVDENEADEENEPEENIPELSAAPKSEPTSIFGAQPSSSNSLFGRVTSAPTPNFGQAIGHKTGAIGLFGSTTGANDRQTWTPDKGIKFGVTTDSNGSTNSGSAPAQSLFGSQTQNPTSGSLFGTTNNIPTFNFAPTANSKSIFSNPQSKPTVPSVLFGGPSGGGLAPPVAAFGGPSPAPSEISTPGEAPIKEGGEDENDPSDEAGQQGGNTKDLSGKGPGEEDEDEVFETRSSIYNLNNGSYVKIGIGRLRVLKNRLSGRSRVVVKVETGKVLMNVGLRKELDYTKVSDSEAKGKVVKIIEFLPEGKSRVWVMKVGTVELAQKLRKTFEENK